ncbi:sugar ABC transporter substrate-binding protein [Paenibacillus sp. CFBP13512]|uniref:ABC transporter substrate-binding protein n=1 Tax=Paenibacillus TaxID=44249 RepID=UPI0010C02407|nr:MULTISPECIES: ABC transporter substrate-binding protein [Paenibacillus]TKJ91167.1 sugar ABC transporter substrate-binding protein [Paenibacillus sp. CFBP13512]CAJ1317593.1 Sugar ABC transporter substrate-binding protein [Paenibacillus nuruki]
MAIKKWFQLTVASLLTVALVSGCGSKSESSTASTNPEDISGDITVITQRTDIVDTVFKDYAAKFKEKYPNVNVNFEALADYESQISIRLNTKDYGDVLLLPTSIPISDLPDFFEPLGSMDELSKKYKGLEERAVDGQAYGIPVAINFSGIIYNKKVFKEAGITETPRTPEQYLKALATIKSKTSAVPLYTNYASGWALTQWESDLTTVAGTTDYVNITQPTIDNNFVAGQPHYELYKLMYDATSQGLIEKDPTTTDWETSKVDLANGKIATMVLGSWAIDQIKSVAENKDDIGFMPFPTNADKVIVPLADDYTIGINVNSENKPAAKAWVDWFTNESNYATEQVGGVSPVIGAELPPTLKEYEGTDITFEAQTPAKAGEEGLVDKIDKEGEIGLWQPDFKKRIIEAALYKKETFDDIMKDLNDKWVAARAEVAK